MFESETYEERCWKAEAENARLREELAAAQATIEQMRETDLKIVGRNLTEEMALAAARLFDKANGRRFGAATLWQVLFDAAPSLAIPTNLDALHEDRAQQIDKVITRLLELGALGDGTYIEELRAMSEAHRARKEGK